VVHDNQQDSLPLGAEILSVNGKSIDYWVKKYYELNTNHRFGWDNQLKRPFPLVRNLWIDKEEQVSIKYNDNNRIDSMVYPTVGNIGYRLRGGSTFFYDHNEKGYVDYFDDTNVLYIRLPSMSNENYSYVDSIIKIGRDKDIRKVVIDIRNNPGGVDRVWMDILGAITKDTIFINSNMGLRNTKEARLAMSDEHQISEWDSVGIKTKVPLLRNQAFITIKWGYPIVPHEQSLKYDGNIYVIQNRMIFSSAGSMSNAAYLCDKIISVGTNTGKLLGFGVAPATFTLPYSKYTFTLECLIELSGREKTAYDYYHDNVEIPVDITPKDIVVYYENNWKNYPATINYIYTKEFLYNFDPVFRRVLREK
jgi:peptidase S41